jgi:hypothetical protein
MYRTIRPPPRLSKLCVDLLYYAGDDFAPVVRIIYLLSRLEEFYI